MELTESYHHSSRTSHSQRENSGQNQVITYPSADPIKCSVKYI